KLRQAPPALVARCPLTRAKKRRLIDNCGHERCYSCMFTSEVCPICSTDNSTEIDGPVKKDIGCNGLRGSEITLYGESPQIQVEKPDKMQPRTKVKTNGHFTTFMQTGNVAPDLTTLQRPDLEGL
ncbi:hypothetical protein NQ318_016181, partial [Aromia moschata]